MNTKYVLIGIIIGVLIISVVGLYMFYPQLTGDSGEYIVTVVENNSTTVKVAVNYSTK